MFDQPLYSIASQEIEQVPSRFHIVIDESHPIFKGHFPGQPVLPGVCTLQIIKECAEKTLGFNIRYGTISMCKFLSMIIPSEKMVDISISINGTTIQSTVSQDEKVMLRLKANYVTI